MLVPMVEIGNVRVRVGEGLVLMGVRVSHPGRQSRMNVGVMPVVVTVTVRVRHGLVGMLVLMPRGQHEVEPGDNARYGRELRRLNALLKERPSEDHPEEGRGGKEE